jgi:hypothetical protein
LPRNLARTGFHCAAPVLCECEHPRRDEQR